MTGSATIRAAWVAPVAAALALALPPLAQAGFSSQLVPLSGLAPSGNTGVNRSRARRLGLVVARLRPSRVP